MKLALVVSLMLGYVAVNSGYQRQKRHVSQPRARMEYRRLSDEEGAYFNRAIQLLKADTRKRPRRSTAQDDYIKLQIQIFQAQKSLGVGGCGDNVGCVGRISLPDANSIGEEDSEAQSPLFHRTSRKLTDAFKSPTDLMFLLDGSKSAKHGQEKQKQVAKLVSKAVQKLVGISPSQSRIGLVIFSTPSATTLKMAFEDFKDGPTIRKAIEDIQFGNVSSDETAIGTGLMAAKEEFFNQSLRSQPDKRKVLFLITNGKNTGDVDPLRQAASLRNAGVRICVAAVGYEVDVGMLKDIAGEDNDCNCYIKYDDFELFKLLIEDAVKEIIE